jgi:nucleoside-diphosphate-sugar epimerase
MKNKSVLITGVSGFLGSQIAKHLILKNYEVIAIKRESSNLWRCQEYIDKIKWVNTDDEQWEDKILDFLPQIIIHSSWSGVSAFERDNWNMQFTNVVFTLKILEIAKKCRTKKIIGFGSQAEYGNFSGIIDENYSLNPNSAYAAAKISVSDIIKNYCSINCIDWYWFRLFSFFGELESDNWFIPTIINKIINGQKMDMTPGEQRYAYMYVGDLAKNIGLIIDSSILSGIYNISSNRAISLQELTNKIIAIIKPKTTQINFGALPYRENQSMHIQGSNLKIEKALGTKLEELDFDTSLNKVISYLLNKR